MVTYMTTQNVCPGTLFTMKCDVLMWSLMRSSEVKRSLSLGPFPKSGVHKRPYQGQERTNLATYTPKYVRLCTLL